MIRIENDCVGCEQCRMCGARKSPHMYCDRCGEEPDELYIVESEHICIDCLPSMFSTITREEVEEILEEEDIDD